MLRGDALLLKSEEFEVEALNLNVEDIPEGDALVITGKGKIQKDTGPIPRQVGILRHQVPQWLRMPPLRDKVLQVSEAHGKHGGSGAYYVYLRK